MNGSSVKNPIPRIPWRGRARTIRTVPDAKRARGHVRDRVVDDEAVVLAHVVRILALVRYRQLRQFVVAPENKGGAY